MKRIQRKRTKGWKMPANTKYIGRGSKWGNPFKVTKFKGFTGWSWQIRDTRPGHCDAWAGYRNKIDAQKVAVRLYRAWVEYKDFSELRGHDLACWCREDEPCHGDVILEKLKENENGNTN